MDLVYSQALQLSETIKASQLRFNTTLSDGRPMPKFITFNEVGAIFTIKTGDRKLAGDYYINIAVDAPAIHPGWSCFVKTWRLTVEVQEGEISSNKLIFISPLADAEINPGDEWTYNIP